MEDRVVVGLAGLGFWRGMFERSRFRAWGGVLHGRRAGRAFDGRTVWTGWVSGPDEGEGEEGLVYTVDLQRHTYAMQSRGCRKAASAGTMHPVLDTIGL